MAPKGPKKASKLGQNHTKTTPKWCQIDPQNNPKVSPNRPKKMFQNPPKWAQNGHILVQKWSKNGAAAPDRVKNGSKRVKKKVKKGQEGFKSHLDLHQIT